MKKEIKAIETVDTVSADEIITVSEQRRARTISYLQDNKQCFDDEIENVVAIALGYVEKNESGSKSAGYTMKENAEGDWVSYLGDRLEFNLTNGKTYNVWIVDKVKYYAEKHSLFAIQYFMEMSKEKGNKASWEFWAKVAEYSLKGHDNAEFWRKVLGLEPEIDASENAVQVNGDITEAKINAEIPYIDADAEFDAETKKLAEEFEEVDAKLADIETQIEELQYKISKLEDLKLTTYDSRIALEVKWREHTYKLDELLDKKIKRGNYEMTLNGVYTVKGNEQDFSTRIKGDRQIALYLWRTNTKLATFESVKEFKAAVDKLGAAMERGDKEFTFPAE